MLRRIRVLLLAALAASAAALSLQIHADWYNYKLPADAYLKDGELVAAGTPGAIKVPKGTPVCRDRDTGVWIKGPYTTTGSVTIGCNWLTVWVPWLGTAQAQQVASGTFKNIFPTGIQVGSGPSGGTPPPPTLSAPWLQTDIGSPPVAGNAFDAQNVLTITGSGDFHKDTSAFHFVYQLKSGNWRIDFPLTSLTGSDEYRSCGPAILDSLGVDVKYTYLTPSFATVKAVLGIRATTGAGVYEAQTYSAGAFSTGILRLEIIGSTQTGYISTDGGMTFAQVGAGTWTPAGTFAIGVHDDSNASTLSTCQGIKPTLTALSSGSPGVLQFTDANGVVAATSSVSETAGTVSLPCLTRSVDTQGAISGDIQNPGTGSAVAGNDFTNPPYPQTKSWANGEGGTKCGSVAILNRAGNQASRTVNYTLGNLTGGVTAGAQTTHTLTITDSNLVAIRTQPGVYLAFNKQCIPYDGVRYGCTTAELLNFVATEICPNANIQGMKILAHTTFFVSDTRGVYTKAGGSFTPGADLGFDVFDPLLNALSACGKYLMIQGSNQFSVPLYEATHQAFPKFTYPSSWSPEGTAAPGVLGLSILNQHTAFEGMEASVWQTDWRDLATEITTAYCNRYGSNPALYGIGIVYWNTSLPINYQNPPAGYSEVNFHSRFREYVAASRSACPTINLYMTHDFATPSLTTIDLNDMRDNTKASMANTDTITYEASWGQSAFTGDSRFGGIDYRGVLRNMEEVETPEMCGYINFQTPAQTYDIWQNGGTDQQGFPILPRRPTTIVVYDATECASPYSPADWKAYWSGTLGGATVFDGLTATHRTPAYVKANVCESSLPACQ